MPLSKIFTACCGYNFYFAALYIKVLCFVDKYIICVVASLIPQRYVYVMHHISLHRLNIYMESASFIIHLTLKPFLGLVCGVDFPPILVTPTILERLESAHLYILQSE